MAFKMVNLIWNNKGNNTKALKKPFLTFCIVFIISIQFESINLQFYTEMDDKSDTYFHFI